MKRSIKIIIIGDSGVGKSSLLYSYIYNKPCKYPSSSIGIDCHTKAINIKDKEVKLTLWDTVGQEYFLSVTKSYYRNSQIVLLVFAIDDMESFKNIGKWISIIKNTNSNESNVTMFLIGNKLDCNSQRKVTKIEAEDYARQNKLIYFELTHNNPELITESMKFIVSTYLDNCEDNEFLVTPPEIESSSNIFDIAKMDGGENYCCM